VSIYSSPTNELRKPYCIRRALLLRCSAIASLLQCTGAKGWDRCGLTISLLAHSTPPLLLLSDPYSAPLFSAVVAVSFLSVVCPTHPHLSYIALLRPCNTVHCAPARMHCSLLRTTRAFCHEPQLRVCPRCPSCHHSCLSLSECCLECLCEGVLSCPLGSTVLSRACECRYTLHLQTN
jgi:hypothetical protein